MLKWLLGRRSAENPQVPLSSPQAFATLFGEEWTSAAGVTVTREAALGVPAVLAAVDFLSSTIASLPLHVFERQGDARERVGGNIDALLNSAVSEGWTAHEWRKWVMQEVLTAGRAYSLILRTRGGEVAAIEPLETSTVEPVGVITARGLRLRYRVRVDGKPPVEYPASRIIDLAFMRAADRVGHISPISRCRNAIGLAIAIERFASRYFQKGGVPPLALTGPFQSAEASERAASDILNALAVSAKEGRNVLVLPFGHELKSIGSDPEKAQLIEAQRWCVEQIARIYNVPLAFLKDLTHGTFSNTEQQDLQFVKHTVLHWTHRIEQELTLKLFGADDRRFVEFNVDGLLRGDFRARMEGFRVAVQGGFMTPNEVRRKLNLEDKPGGDTLLIQGATVPLPSQVNDGGEDG